MTPYARRGIHANVDFFAGAVYYLLGIPSDLFVPIFAVGRIPGWTIQILEQMRHNILIRPLLQYTGERSKEYIPIDKRDQLVITDNFIKEKILEKGRISSKDFIDLCLYGEEGYYTYSRKNKNVYFKDYATSPLTHPVFGYLLSNLIYNLIGSFHSEENINIIELGAGNGTLAYDIKKSLNTLGCKNFSYEPIDKLSSNSVEKIYTHNEKKIGES